MKKKSNGRNPAKTTKANGIALEKKILAYSVAAGAALALAQPADARIHYSGVINCPVQTNTTSCPVDFGTGVTPFSFQQSTTTRTLGSCRYYSGSVLIQAGSANQGVVNTNSPVLPRNLPFDFKIYAGAQFGFNGGGLLNKTSTHSTCSDEKVQRANGREGQRRGDNLGTVLNPGHFQKTTGYIGVKFEIPDYSCNPVYGWIRYAGSNGVGTIIDWAYEDNCEPIKAGQTSDVRVPTFTEWGFFLFAALLLFAGVRKLREPADRKS